MQRHFGKKRAKPSQAPNKKVDLPTVAPTKMLPLLINPAERLPQQQVEGSNPFAATIF